MTDSAYVKFYTSDFLGGTSGLTAATKGVYITLLMLMYETEAPLKRSYASLARACGASNSAFKKAMEALIEEGKIVILEDGVWSEKVEKHISTRANLRRRNAFSAFVGWEKRKQNQGPPDANASATQCQPEPEPEPEEEKINFSSIGLELSQLFDAAGYARPAFHQLSKDQQNAARRERDRLDCETGPSNVVPLPERLEPER